MNRPNATAFHDLNSFPDFARPPATGSNAFATPWQAMQHDLRQLYGPLQVRSSPAAARSDVLGPGSWPGTSSSLPADSPGFDALLGDALLTDAPPADSSLSDTLPPAWPVAAAPSGSAVEGLLGGAVSGGIDPFAAATPGITGPTGVGTALPSNPGNLPPSSASLPGGRPFDPLLVQAAAGFEAARRAGGETFQDAWQEARSTMPLLPSPDLRPASTPPEVTPQFAAGGAATGSPNSAASSSERLTGNSTLGRSGGWDVAAPPTLVVQLGDGHRLAKTVLQSVSRKIEQLVLMHMQHEVRRGFDTYQANLRASYYGQ